MNGTGVDTGRNTLRLSRRQPHNFGDQHSAMRQSRARLGLTLIEVILALAILAGAMVMLGELVRIGSRQARAARDASKGVVYCESIMAQIEATIIPVTGVSQAPVDIDPNWVYSVVSQPTGITGLLDIVVVVRRADDTRAQPFEIKLQRRMVDPELLVP
jgi:prepilin-type N-terminal cleavage/methylation domain-containing protein